MKSRLTNQVSTLALTVVATLMMTFSLATHAADDAERPNRVTGYAWAPLIDPVTGQTLPPPPWKDPDWKAPDKVLAEVNYDGLPVSEVARILRDEFKNAFDILIPRSWQDPNSSGWHDPNIPVEPLEPGSETIKMQLKNVTASEVFNAMNMTFAGENRPYRWELRMNGKRPTAILRVLPELLPPPQSPPPQPKPLRMVYFVGDLVDDKFGIMTMEQLVKTLSEVYQMSGESDAVIKFHKAAQLLIVSGTDDDIQFIQRTLSAMRTKVHMDQNAGPKPAESPTNGGPAKPR